MEPNSSTSDQAFLEELRRHRAELRESMSALEDALAAPATADQARWAQRVHVALVELSGDFREHIDITEGPDGLYRDLLKTSPRLSDAVASLTREHALICGQVDKPVGPSDGTRRHRGRGQSPRPGHGAPRADSSDTDSEAPISSSRPTSSTSGARPEQNPRSRLHHDRPARWPDTTPSTARDPAAPAGGADSVLSPPNGARPTALSLR